MTENTATVLVLRTLVVMWAGWVWEVEKFREGIPELKERQLKIWLATGGE